MAKMPDYKIPDFIKRPLNSIEYIFQNTCGTEPWIIFLKYATPAAAKAFVRYITFGIGDVARGALKPNRPRKRGNRHARKGGKGGRGKGFKGIPEFGNILGAKIREVSGAGPKPTVYNGVGQSLIVVDDVSQRVLYWWMVYDIIDDFLYEIFLGMFFSKKCAQAFGRYGLVVGSNWPVLELTNPNPPGASAHVVRCQGMGCSIGGFSALDSNEYGLVVLGQWTNEQNDPLRIRLQVFSDPGLLNMVDQGKARTIEPGSTANVLEYFTFKAPAGRYIAAHVENDELYLAFSEGNKLYFLCQQISGSAL